MDMRVSRLYKFLRRMIGDSQNVILTSGRRFFFRNSINLVLNSDSSKKDQKASREDVQLVRQGRNFSLEYFTMSVSSARQTFEDRNPYEDNRAVVELKRRIKEYESGRVISEKLKVNFKEAVGLMKYIAHSFARKVS